MNRADLGDLLAFLAVARERSFTKAAAKLDVLQSALSRTISKLEAPLGLQLLRRTTRSISPTEASDKQLATGQTARAIPTTRAPTARMSAAPDLGRARQFRRLMLTVRMITSRAYARGRTESVCAEALNGRMNRPRDRVKGTPSPRAVSTGYRENLLIAALPGAERRRLLAACKPVEMQFGSVLCKQYGRIRHVYFPTGGFISLLTELGNKPGLEMGLVGAEGAAGITLALGLSLAPVRAVVQGTGSALRIEAARFATELHQSPALRSAIFRYISVFMIQLAVAATCTRFHTVEARLARWLLMTRDQARSDQFYLTQEFMAYMLGVRRVGVTRAARELRARRLVGYVRGRINILDVRGLEDASCSCYASAKEAYTRFMRPTRMAASRRAHQERLRSSMMRL
jgi:CRP-like cAMP-binding protein